MKSVVLGIGLMIIVSVVARVVLETQKQSASQALVSDSNSVRLD